MKQHPSQQLDPAGPAPAGPAPAGPAPAGPAPADPAPAVGIDLGTTHSLLAWHDNKELHHVRDENATGPSDSRLIPSIVWWDEEAKKPRVGTPPSTLASPPISSVKRLLGRHADECLALSLPYTIRAAHDGQTVEVQLGPQWFSPVEISALILSHLKAMAKRSFAFTPTHAVITVPAYFDDGQRQATRDAASLARLEVIRIINEPTAASLAYGLEKHVEGCVAVYDLGGGTFDISILKIEKGIFRVLSTVGDTRLGGDDFDRVLAEFISNLEHKNDNDHKLLSTSLLEKAKELKHLLSSQKKATIHLDDGSTHTITQERFNELIDPLIKKTLTACTTAWNRARPELGRDADAVDAVALDAVVLVGGSTRIPAVYDNVEKFFKLTPKTDLNPDDIVSIGAAKQASVLTKGGSTSLLLDVCPLTLGIETVGGAVSQIIHANTAIPIKAKEIFSTSKDNQTAVAIHVVQGEREFAADNRSLARFSLKGLPPMPAGLAKIEVSFKLDANGILSVTAYETRSQTEAKVDVNHAHALSKEQINAMLNASVKHAEDDFTRRQQLEQKNSANAILKGCEDVISSHRDILHQEEFLELEKKMQHVKDALRDNAHEKLIPALDDLKTMTKPLADRVISKALSKALQKEGPPS